MHKKNTASNEALLNKIKQARKFIETNYFRDVSLEDIAAIAHLSKAHLTRKFKEAHQLTPYQYLIEIRLAKAVDLLQTTGLPVTEIVNRIGFYSTSSFIRMFKTEYGITPVVFRQQKKGTI